MSPEPTPHLDFSYGHFSDWTGTLAARQFNSQAARFAAWLSERVTLPRSRIGLWGRNSLAYLTALYGIWRAGHTAVPFSTRLTPREMFDAVHGAELAALLVSRDFPPSHGDALAGIPIYPLTPKLDTESSPPVGRAVSALDESEVAVLICSSGTRGRIKIVPLALGSLLDHALTVCAHLQVTSHDSWLICLPLHHVGGLAIPFRCLLSGASVVISQSADPEEINRLIDAGEATVVSVVPTVLDRLLSKREGRPFPGSLRAMVVGGGPVPESLLARCPQALATYGLTEAGSMVTCARPRCSASERRSAGPPLPHTQVRIIGGNGTDCEAGKEGEIVVRGPGMAHAYLRDAERSAHTFREGWIHTGDIGFLDREGCLHVLARREDVVLSGGENIYPVEIEAALREHPRVIAAVVLPVDDPHWGQVAAAMVAVSPGSPVTEDEITTFLMERLARHKLPRRFVIGGELPLLPNGKLDLPEIRRILERAQGVD